MDIAGASIAMSSMKTMNEVSIAVLDKVMEVMEVEGAMLAEIMQVPVDMTIGSNMDMRI